MDKKLIEDIKNRLTDYPWRVVSGDIVACEYVKLACQRFINYLDRDDLEYRIDKVLSVINFCQHLKHFSGKHNNKPFVLSEWQKFVVAHCYGFYHKGTDERLVHDVYISVARKNGKSAFVAAAFGLYQLIADGENEAQVILSANSYQQSQILYKFCNLYLKSLGTKVDSLFLRYRDQIKFPKTDSFLKCIAADASKADGYGPNCAIIDEYHEATDSSMYDVMVSGQAARENPMMVTITTAGFNIFGACANMERRNIELLYGTREDDSNFTLVYTLDKDDDWNDPKVWIKANPSMGEIVKETFISEQIAKCKNDPAAEVAVKTKNLNIWCDSATGWIPMDYILKASQKVNLKDYEGEYCYIGLDLASTDDLTAISVLIPQDDGTMIFKSYAFVPEEQLKVSVNRDKYKKWKKKGELIVCPGNVTDYDYIINKILEIGQTLNINKIAFDSWNSTQAVIQMTEQGLPMEPYSQSIGSMNRPTKELKRLLLSNKVILDDNELVRWCFGNVVIKVDVNDNEKITKTSYDNKIDPTVAMTMALGSWLTTEHWNNEISATNF